MAGMDRNRFVESDQDLDEFTCGICRDIFVNPVVTPCCRQIFCSDCITKWLNQYNTCPNDWKRLTSDGIIPSPRIVSNMLNKLKVKCNFEPKGCPIVIPLSLLTIHIKYCIFNTCATCGMTAKEDSPHNCVQNLMIKNNGMENEIIRIRKENLELKKSVEYWEMKYIQGMRQSKGRGYEVIKTFKQNEVKSQPLVVKTFETRDVARDQIYKLLVENFKLLQQLLQQRANQF